MSIKKEYLLTLLVEVYALLEVAVELNTVSNSARAAYLSEDVLVWFGADTVGPAGAGLTAKPLPCSLPPRGGKSRLKVHIRFFKIKYSHQWRWYFYWIIYCYRIFTTLPLLFLLLRQSWHALNKQNFLQEIPQTFYHSQQFVHLLFWNVNKESSYAGDVVGFFCLFPWYHAIVSPK